MIEYFSKLNAYRSNITLDGKQVILGFYLNIYIITEVNNAVYLNLYTLSHLNSLVESIRLSCITSRYLELLTQASYAVQSLTS